MAATRAELVDAQFIRSLREGVFPTARRDAGAVYRDLQKLQMKATDWVSLFETQVMSRQVDFMARILREKGTGYYTIGSSGHEGTAGIAHAFRPSDMAFLHYRSAAFFIERLKQTPAPTPLYDLLLSLSASADDPISGGRHKVLGSLPGLVPPQTSTIASHLPKAVGAALAIPRAHQLGIDPQTPGAPAIPKDAVAICSFGDASANHSTSQGAFNTAEWLAYQGIPLPLVFVCEDNGIGISVRTPPRWIESTFSRRPVLHYLQCDGLDLVDTVARAREAAHYARTQQKPVFLHVKTLRLFGHAGADVETSYRALEEISAIEAQDPLLHTARFLVEYGILSPHQVLEIYESVRARLARIANETASRPRLRTASQVMASIVPPVRSYRPSVPDLKPATHSAIDSGATATKQHMAKLLNAALADILLQYPQSVILGEDVGKKGGVYNVTSGLQDKVGTQRVFDSLLDEQSILGMSMGLAHYGFIPIPEIQFLAYVHNAEDQIRGEAATLSFFSEGRFTNPMVIRIAGLPYQKGFGGHFHNDNSMAVFRDIPGIIVACPSRGDDAVKMLRACARMAHEQRRVVVFLEPIALYMTRDLHTAGDAAWCFPYPPPTRENEIALGEVGVSLFEGTHNKHRLCIVSYANGYYLSLQAAQLLAKRHGVTVKVIDLRWMVPLPQDALVRETSGYDQVLVVDECRVSGSPSEEIVTTLIERSKAAISIKRVVATDSFIPLGEASTATLPSRDSILDAAINHLGIPTEGPTR